MKTLLLILSFSLTPFAHAENCKFDLDPTTAKVTWTAFKTTQKVAVSGSFTSVDYTGSTSKQKSLKALLSGVHAKIAIKDNTSSNSGNPTRDQTVFDHFFSKFKNATSIEGKAKNVKGDEKEGTLDLEIKMNGTSHTVPAKYTMDKDGHFEAKTEFDMMDFALKGPYEEIHKTCEKLHTGADGVSKTWSTVEAKFNATIAKTCNP